MACWSTIKHDVMAIFDHFCRLAGGNFSELNSAMIALLPKKESATCMGNFRPISLRHYIAKLIAKVLSSLTRLSPPRNLLFRRLNASMTASSSFIIVCAHSTAAKHPTCC